jgi:hypothetical protein
MAVIISSKCVVSGAWYIFLLISNNNYLHWNMKDNGPVTEIFIMTVKGLITNIYITWTSPSYCSIKENDIYSKL